jgi:hypothetical protein
MHRFPHQGLVTPDIHPLNSTGQRSDAFTPLTICILHPKIKEFKRSSLIVLALDKKKHVIGWSISHRKNKSDLIYEHIVKRDINRLRVRRRIHQRNHKLAVLDTQ